MIYLISHHFCKKQKQHITEKKEKNRAIGCCKQLAPNNVDHQPIRYKTVHPTFLFGPQIYNFFFKQVTVGEK